MSTSSPTLALVIGLSSAPIVPSDRGVATPTAVVPGSESATSAATGLPTIESDAITEAKRIHARGRVAFDLADYDAAIA
ncbi:MAG: hypothetical protein KC486_09525, partial [Myxococcales bacterium]|nr:hypothetical protein [Myxococcales bacterium]